MANNNRIFINQSGSDNERRLSHVEAFAIIDAIGWLELALKNGEKIASGITESIFGKVLEELTSAFKANTSRTAYQQATLTDETYDESVEKVKKVFATTRESREKGLI